MNTPKKLLILSFSTMTLLTTGCGNNKKQEQSTAEATVSGTIAATEKAQTYQHIAMANIKANKWDAYIKAMNNNIYNSRKEPGNIIFTLFQPEDGSHKVAFVERFKDRAAFEEHLKADYLPEKITKESLIGEMELRELTEVPEVPAIEPADADEVSTPRNVIVFFEIKPEKRQTFIDGFTEVTPYARKAPGNIRFNLFQQANDQNKFVLVESWESVGAHEKHLAQDYSKKLDTTLEGVFVTNPADTRWLAKDISQ